MNRPTVGKDSRKSVRVKGLVKINVSTKYVENGGSEAFSYSPAFPTGYGKMLFVDKDEQSSSGSIEPTITYDPNSDI